MDSKTRKLTTTAMLCALAYTAAAVGRVPLILFLKYDPKDIVIAVSGLVFGPHTAFVIAVVVSLAEMVTISENGVLGFLMNVISSCSFACVAAFIHRKRRSAVFSLICGWGCMVFVMLLWNYLITPFYMGYPREAVAELLIPAFLPFNLIKGGLNAAIAMLLYRPAALSLQRAHLIETAQTAGKHRAAVGVMLVAALIIAACVLLILSLKGVF